MANKLVLALESYFSYHPLPPNLFGGFLFNPPKARFDRPFWVLSIFKLMPVCVYPTFVSVKRNKQHSNNAGKPAQYNEKVNPPDDRTASQHRIVRSSCRHRNARSIGPSNPVGDDPRSENQTVHSAHVG